LTQTIKFFDFHHATGSPIAGEALRDDVEPFAYLRDILERIVAARTKANELSSSPPWARKASRAPHGCQLLTATGVLLASRGTNFP
jgi:hypothetical protein